MRRRRSQSADSLELLLDTICNTFGGVLFIAILVVILLQMAGESQPPHSDETIAPEDYQQLKTRFQALSAELASLRETRVSQDRLVARFAPDEIRSLIEQRNRLQATRNELQARHDEHLAANAERRDKIEQVQRKSAAVQQNLEHAREQRRQLQARLTRDRESRIQRIRMPIVRSAGLKRSIAVILRYGRMYVWHRYDRFGNFRGLNTEEFVVVGEQGDALVTTPKPTAGIPLNDQPNTAAALRARLRPFSPKEFYIIVAVRPDSFGHFQYLRDLLIDMGFEYRLLALYEDTTLIDRGGTDNHVQ